MTKRIRVLNETTTPHEGDSNNKLQWAHKLPITPKLQHNDELENVFSLQLISYQDLPAIDYNDTPEIKVHRISICRGFFLMFPIIPPLLFHSIWIWKGAQCEGCVGLASPLLYHPWHGVVTSDFSTAHPAVFAQGQWRTSSLAQGP